MTLLSGIRVLTCLSAAGPFCTMMMADYGADVVEDRRAGAAGAQPRSRRKIPGRDRSTGT